MSRLPETPRGVTAVPTFASFYTNSDYRKDCERLERCCRHFGLPFMAIEGEELGGWKRNCNQKPRLLQRLRESVAGPIVWLDADCIIHRRPQSLLEPRTDDAVLWQGGISDKHYVSSQVMWWGDTPVARAMIAEWAERSRDNPESLADPLLKATCESWRGRAKVAVLPAAYLKPYWKPVDGVAPDDIVISGNERRAVHPDATPRQIRTRLEPLRLPFAG
jgi:hypothetical protein